MSGPCTPKILIQNKKKRNNSKKMNKKEKKSNIKSMNNIRTSRFVTCNTKDNLLEIEILIFMKEFKLSVIPVILFPNSFWKSSIQNHICFNSIKNKEKYQIFQLKLPYNPTILPKTKHINTMNHKWMMKLIGL